MSERIEFGFLGGSVPAAARPAEDGNRRTLALAAFGAVAGLLIAGYGLFTAPGTSTLFVPAENVALVNQQPLSRVDYMAALQATFGTDLAGATADQRRSVLETMIREELFVQRARELDVAGADPDVRSAMVRAVEEQMAATVLTEQPPDEKLRAFFEAHRETYATEGTMTVADLVFPDAAAASAAATGAADGARSAPGGHDSGKVTGAEFYFAAKIHLGEDLFAVARLLPNGGVSKPIPAPDGVHVLAMIRNEPPAPRTFAAVRARVLDDYRRDAVARLQAQESAFLRERANILLAPDLQ